MQGREDLYMLLSPASSCLAAVLGLHEFERSSGIEFVSRANHAATFDSIAFSTQNTRPLFDFSIP